MEREWTIERVARATGGRVLGGGSAEQPCRAVATDTRTLGRGDLFVALCGERFDGHNFVAAAVAKGAAALVVSKKPEPLPPVPIILVEDTLKALGAVPVGITIAESYDSMSKGVVDGALLPPETLKAFKLGEVTKYVTQVDMLYNTVHYTTMNKDVWNSFPKHIQDAINEVNEEVFEIATELWDGDGGLSQDGLDFAVENGNELITLSDEETERWKEKLSRYRPIMLK